MTDEVTLRQDENAHKVAYVVKRNPERNLQEIIAMLAMPAIDINCALWQAQDLGLIGEPNKETGQVEFLKDPADGWKFGVGVERLRRQLVFALTKLAKKENDLTYEEIQGWCQGYTSHDLDIAMDTLQQEKVIAVYELTDPKDLKSTYTFYTLWANSEQMWGRSRFKVQPTGEEVPDTSEPVADDETTNASEDAGESEQ